jgi:hypothetical protein
MVIALALARNKAAIEITKPASAKTVTEMKNLTSTKYEHGELSIGSSSVLAAFLYVHPQKYSVL